MPWAMSLSSVSNSRCRVRSRCAASAAKGAAAPWDALCAACTIRWDSPSSTPVRPKLCANSDSKEISVRYCSSIWRMCTMA